MQMKKLKKSQYSYSCWYTERVNGLKCFLVYWFLPLLCECTSINFICISVLSQRYQRSYNNIPITAQLDSVYIKIIIGCTPTNMYISNIRSLSYVLSKICIFEMLQEIAAVLELKLCIWQLQYSVWNIFFYSVLAIWLNMYMFVLWMTNKLSAA